MENHSNLEKIEIASLIKNQEKQFVRKLTANKSKVYAINVIRELHEQIDVLAEKTKKKPGVHFDCKAGCSFCCSLRVAATPPEVFLIARQLKQLSIEAQADLMDRLKIHSEAAHSLHTDDFFLPCIFLDKGRCAVYAIRPAMCRKYLGGFKHQVQKEQRDAA